MEAYQKNSFWFSKLEDARTCLRLYRLKHIDGVVPHDESLDSVCGSAMHLALKDILIDGDDGIEIFDMYWDSVPKDLKRFSYSHEELRNCAHIWLTKFKRLHAPKFKVVQMEERHHGFVGEHAFEGTADFIGYFNDVPSILDFKTSSKRWDRRQAVVSEQTKGYAKLAKDTLGFEAKQSVHFIFVKDRKAPSIQNPIIQELTSTIVCSTMDNVKEQIDDLVGRTRFPKNTSNCIRGPIVCAAYEICHGNKGAK